jgi:hypothetical protein
MVLDQAQNGLRNLSATSNSRLNFVSVILCLGANQAQVDHRESMRNGFTQNAEKGSTQRLGRGSKAEKLKS